MQDASSFKFTNTICESFNKSWMVFHECRLRVAKRNVIVLNINGTILHPTNAVNINSQVLKKANGYKPWLFNITFDFCEYQRRHHIPYFKMLFDLFRNSTNFDHKCPFNVSNIFNHLY